MPTSPDQFPEDSIALYAAGSPAPAGIRRGHPRAGAIDGVRTARLSPRRAFWFSAAAFAVQMGFGTAPTPLWPLYEARDGFGPTTATVAFAQLFVGASLGFLGLGHLSDRHGRRRVIVPALLLAIVAALMLTARPDLPGLLAGRLLTGVALGLMASTATAYLTDLYAAGHPGRPGSPVPGTVATAANLGGLALGPLAGGVIAQWAPQPLMTTQLAFATAMAVLMVLVAAGPETVNRQKASPETAGPQTAGPEPVDSQTMGPGTPLQKTAGPYTPGSGTPVRRRPARFALRPGGRLSFAGAGGLAFAAFTTFGLFSALGASMLRDRLGITAPLAGGLPGFVMFFAAAAGQLAMGRASGGRLLATGTVLFPLGLGLVALSLAHPALWLYLAASAVAGAGAGLLFKGGAGAAVRVAVPASRAGVLAVFFVIAYAGMGLPVIVFSVALQHIGPLKAMAGLAVVISACAVASTQVVRRTARR
ncbi:MFS transporter [Microbispora sp. NPDC049125]|uniref:MFS transporter n=1 Tax=Microbispora sp. NPDC049125 TaxID=3154929 RepID=UPI00346539CD